MRTNTVPAICVFFKQMSGNRYVKELANRVVVTWDVSEPYGNIQDFTWTKTVAYENLNRPNDLRTGTQS